MTDKELGKLRANRNSINRPNRTLSVSIVKIEDMKQILNGPATSKLFHTLKTLKHRLRLRKMRVIDLTTKHSIDQPLQKWEWPKGTWLQNRMKSVRNMKDPTYDTPRKRSNVDGQGRSSRKNGPSRLRY